MEGGLGDRAKSALFLIESPSTGEPDAGNPPVRFGGRGGAQARHPYPYFPFVPAAGLFLAGAFYLRGRSSVGVRTDQRTQRKESGVGIADRGPEFGVH